MEMTVDPMGKDLAELKVGIAGLGLIGGSLAQRFAAAGARTFAWNHHEAPYEAARATGIECVGSLEALAESGVDILFLCTPLRAMEDMLDTIAPVIPPSTTLSDVGSVKTQVHDAVVAAGLGRQYVGAHPMAGSEFSGYAASSPRLLDGAMWALTFDETTDYLRYLLMARVVTETLGNTFIGVDNDTHDLAAALISHMPHVVATALVNELVDSPERSIASALSAGSWRDMTRVALTDPQRTQAMVEENPANVARLVRSMARRLDAAADILEGSPSPAAESEAQTQAPDDAADNTLDGFFMHGNSYRRFKEAQREGVPLESGQLDVLSLTWRRQLLESARRGERISRVTGIRSFTVQWQPADD